MNKYKHVVSKEEEDERLDKVLVALNKGHSRHQIQSWIKDGFVTVNDQKVKANYRCKKADILRWKIATQQPVTIKAEKIPLSIVYEDDSIIVLNKPSGMLVHPTVQTQSQTLVNALKHHTDRLSTIGGEERPGIVHRLDQQTSGIMVVCKDNETHEHLQRQFKEKSVIRIYEAIVHGSVEHATGIIQAPIGRNPHNRLKMAVVDDGKKAETRFRVLGRGDSYTHVRCQLITGRMHQIRVHMKYINHPIVGDPVYSRKKADDMKNQALFARTIGFIHPKTAQYVEFTVERPEKFTKLLKLYKIKS